MENLHAKQQISSYIIHSQEEEIKRIALELHEGVGQNLYSILTGLQFVESTAKEPHMKNYVREMEMLIEKTIQEIRLLSVELHPPSLTTLGLLPAMKSYIKLYTSTFGILVDLESTGEEKTIPERNRIAIFRVCQEALTNIAKYADTSNVKMNFVWNIHDLKISIHDFGRGFQLLEQEDAYHSPGLAAMKERMLLTGGHCTISSKIGEGTSIELSLPI
ncbi:MULTISPECIES: sensor histidine kinase [Bacillaceae]|uniref:sensor histidine kinase n=1 Tax=Bacillaceae TaxID=186817 RepID=UPI00118A8106|nr:histidine kinase [Bacillus sp. S3]QCJ41453.1 sensor histidine kinase [Bacillus sp. S3]